MKNQIDELPKEHSHFLARRINDTCNQSDALTADSLTPA